MCNGNRTWPNLKLDQVLIICENDCNQRFQESKKIDFNNRLEIP